MENNKDKTFWSIDEESDEEFETIINASKKEEKLKEPKTKGGILSSEKMDFLWSDDEEVNVFKGTEGIKPDVIEEPKTIQSFSPERDSEIKEFNNEWTDTNYEENDNYSPVKNDEQEIHFEDNENIVYKYNQDDKLPGKEYHQHVDSNYSQDDQSKITETYRESFYSDNTKETEILNDRDQTSGYYFEQPHNGKGIENLDITPKYKNDDFLNEVKEDLQVDDKKKNVQDLEKYYAENIQEAEVLQNISDNKTLNFDADLFDAKDSDDADLFESNTIIKDLEMSVKNLNLDDSEKIVLVDKKDNLENNLLEVSHVTDSCKMYLTEKKENLHTDDSDYKNLQPLINLNAETKSYDIFYEDSNEEEDSHFYDVISNLPQNVVSEESTFHEEIKKKDDFIFNEVETQNVVFKQEENIIKPDNNFIEVSKKLQFDEVDDDNIQIEEVTEDFIINNNQMVDSTFKSEVIEVESMKNPIATTDDKLINISSSFQGPRKSSGDLLIARPIPCMLGTNVITYYQSVQTRYTKEGSKKEHNVNIFNFYKLNKSYLITNHDIPESYESNSLNYILQILKLKDIHPDSICKIIGAKEVNYTSKSYTDSECIPDINTALNMSNYNTNLAVDYCLNKKMWTLALIISKMDQKVVNRVLSELVDEDMKSLFFENKFIMKRHWKEYFMHFANSKDSLSREKYIREVCKTDIDSGYLILISLHLCKIIDLSDYLEYFSHKHQLLQLLLHIHKKFNKINNIDLLIYEFICDIKDRNSEFAKEFYKNNKKELRKDLQYNLDEIFKLNWNFGIKDVLTFGMAKILDVQETEIIPKNNTEKKLPSSKVPVKILQPLKTDTPTYIKDDHGIKKEEVKKVLPDKKTGELYIEQKHSKSFADFFDNDIQEKEFTSEDDTALFLSKFSIEDEDKLGIQKDTSTVSESEEKGSFFSIFNVFKKKSYKIDVKASDDIRYDPVTKKWVSGNQNEIPKQSAVVKSQVPIPKRIPSTSQNESISATGFPVSKKSSVDLKKMSLYAGKKKTSSVGFSTLKKDGK